MEKLCQKCGTLLWPGESRCRTCGFDPKAAGGSVPEIFKARADLEKRSKGLVGRVAEQVKAVLSK